MVKISSLFISLILLNGLNENVIGQNCYQEIRTGRVVEDYPSFLSITLKDVLDSLVLYPATALKDSLQGTVFMECWVETDGSTSSCIILKGVREDLDQEAIRVGNLLKFDEPARHRGKPIRIEYPIMINFIIKADEK